MWTDSDGVRHAVRILTAPAHDATTACMRFGWYRMWFDDVWRSEYTFPDLASETAVFETTGTVTCLHCLTAKDVPWGS